MTDQELDRALAAAVNVDHAPDFRARVRARVAAEPARVWWPVPWRFAVGGVALATLVIAVAIVGWPRHRDSETDAVAITSPPAHLPAVPEREPTTVQEIVEEKPTALATPARRPALNRPRATESPLPKVLVDDEEVRAIQLLITRFQRQLVPAEMPTEASFSPPLPVLPLLSPIEVAPMVAIEPLPTIERLTQGDSQS